MSATADCDENLPIQSTTTRTLGHTFSHSRRAYEGSTERESVFVVVIVVVVVLLVVIGGDDGGGGGVGGGCRRDLLALLTCWRRLIGEELKGEDGGGG